MINIDILDGEIKKNDISNGYIFCGLDEELIKISVNSIINKVVEKDFLDLNLIKLDGLEACCIKNHLPHKRIQEKPNASNMKHPINHRQFQRIQRVFNLKVLICLIPKL